jgi:hypothetical protein
MILWAAKFSIVSILSWWIFEQSKPGGSMLMSMDLVSGLYFCCFAGLAADGRDGPVLRANGLAAKSASDTPVMQTSSPTKTRRLKNADREVDFFFM